MRKLQRGNKLYYKMISLHFTSNWDWKIFTLVFNMLFVKFVNSSAWGGGRRGEGWRGWDRRWVAEWGIEAKVWTIACLFVYIKVYSILSKAWVPASIRKIFLIEVYTLLICFYCCTGDVCYFQYNYYNN